MLDEDRMSPEDGYELWLRYLPITNKALLGIYQNNITQIACDTSSPTLDAALDEFALGLSGLLGIPIPVVGRATQPGALIIGTPEDSQSISDMQLHPDLGQIDNEGYVIRSMSYDSKRCIAIAAQTDLGVLYGVFHFLRHLQTLQPLEDLRIVSSPKIKLRMLNHWDNLDGTIERGYAGGSLWDWHKLPDYISPRYRNYARANASIGINGAVLNNVNANALILSKQYLVKVAALADVFRPYGIRVYLTARFSAPMEIGNLTTADPFDPTVNTWWQAKIAEIYQLVPDFGGFLVKANSEGQPGPQDYCRSHADGANLLADALALFGGVVIWRTFVDDEGVPDDRSKLAYDELVPQDGQFQQNVLLQVKNGPVDFQPREPYHTLFGAMPQTPLALEVQITQEYLGCATHLVYLAPLYKETLDADTYCSGPRSQVAKVVDGSLEGHSISAMAGVSNIGSDRNWCGHPFAAANWFAFGRLAWDHTLSARKIAEDWLRMTFTNDERFVEPATEIMIGSREAVVNYMTPLGLHHLFAGLHHYGPGPWDADARADWTPPYYHRADPEGLGFDRTSSGSGAVNQYRTPYRDQLADLATCPENLLLWFHHVSWDHTLKSGGTLWEELCYKYNQGVAQVRQMQASWESLGEFVDLARFQHVQSLLTIQEKEARWWRDACLLYFQTFSGQPIPARYEQPTETLDYFINLRHYFVPGIPEIRFNVPFQKK
jgi:alpha-glucuronidase